MDNPLFVCATGDVEPGKSKSFVLTTHSGNVLEIALFNIDGKYFAISNICQHKGGPLSKGTLDGSIITCPWHGWKYSIVDGMSPHKGGDSVDSYETAVADGKVFVGSSVPVRKGRRVSRPHKKYSDLENAVAQHLRQQDKLQNGSESRKVRVLGISATNANDKVAPRPSTSESALEYALDYARTELAAESVMVKLRQLSIRDCEGYYSKNPRACIFPCSISEMDEGDQMIEIYDRMILWADVVLVATPIRWGSASSLYYKIVQRLNSVQNQMPTYDNILIRDKVAAFIITGGQDNVQHVAGEMMSFWTQLGFVLAKFPFVGWSRGWYAEDTENNYDATKNSEQFKKDIARTVRAAITMSDLLRKGRYDERLLEKPDFQSSEAL
ncbi:MAG TPA: Rieske 2Fe-2S domain-containing protein [Nitrososphaera sp.]|nr:Rieske 2Fe-2S domain-containing protein [Nitrososphaera sp.]